MCVYMEFWEAQLGVVNFNGLVRRLFFMRLRLRDKIFLVIIILGVVVFG